jgi:hypothetical protein
MSYSEAKEHFAAAQKKSGAKIVPFAKVDSSIKVEDDPI